MRTPRANRRSCPSGGFALPAAIFAIVVVGVLVTGGFFVARQESRVGTADEHAQLAFYMAERGIADAIDSLSAEALTSIPIWDTLRVSDTLDAGVVDVKITRTAERLFFLDGTSRVTGRGNLSGATRRLGLVARLFTALIDPPAALATTGNLRIGGSSIINGNDSTPDGWGAYCDPSDYVDKPGIVIDETDSIEYSGAAYDIDGEPAVQEDPTLTPDSLLTFGELGWDDLVAMANIDLSTYLTTSSPTIAPAADSVQLPDGSWICDTSNYTVWGDPISPGGACGSYFPIIYVDSAHSNPLKLQGSDYGQGILLVGHDLRVSGGFTFYGPVIVKGTFDTQGTGGHVRGGVIAANANFDQSEVLGDAVVQFSSCGVKRALLGNSNLTRMKPLAERNWVDLSNIAN